MRNPENLLNSLCSHNSQKDYRYKNLYRNLYNPELYLAAYRNISKNDGALTKGVNENTADGMSLKSEVGDAVEDVVVDKIQLKIEK